MGLVPGDVIQNVNGYPVSSGREVQEVMLPWIVDPVFTVTGTISGKGNRKYPIKEQSPFGRSVCAGMIPSGSFFAVQGTFSPVA